jgi:hypothetical protein
MKFLKFFSLPGIAFVLSLFLTNANVSAQQCISCENLHDTIVNQSQEIESERENIQEMHDQIQAEMIELNLTASDAISGEISIDPNFEQAIHQWINVRPLKHMMRLKWNLED